LLEVMKEAMKHELRLFFIALQFFTRVPIPGWVGFEPSWLHACARHFPLVGFFIGVAAAAVLWVGHALFTPTVAVLLSMAASVVLTGAFHEDGWADTCDALGGAVSRERALVIMKDSRIGSYGAVGLVLMLSLKAAATLALPLTGAMAAVILAHTASRFAPVLLIRFLRYGGDLEHAKAKPLAQQISVVGLSVASVWVLLLAACLVAWQPAWWKAVAVSLLAALVGVLWCARWFQKRLGGYTGDTLGASQQITEVLILLSWVAALRSAA
jgi:adenosylcobinamide-GDP ribazoletransferase